MLDLAPQIFRQRLIIEGIPSKVITNQEIFDYLRQLGTVLDMQVLTEPITHRSDKFGWAGWVHWETSGSHFYAWEEPKLFFSVDIYTCKKFVPQDAVSFTKEYFRAKSISSKEV